MTRAIYILFAAILMTTTPLYAQVEQESKLSTSVERSEPSANLNATGLSLRTNLLYWMAATPNLGVEYRTESGRTGYMVNGGYAPLADQYWEHNFGGWFISPEVRFYAGEHKRGFLGVTAVYSGYNVKLTDTGYQGEMAAAGLSGGYRTVLSRNLDIDFSTAVGYGWFKYDSYNHHDNGSNTFVDKGKEQWMVAPIQLGVSLIWRTKR